MKEVLGVTKKLERLRLELGPFIHSPREYLRKVVSEQQKDWDEHIPRFLLACRSTINDSTSRLPAKVIFGTEIKLHGDLHLGAKSDTEKDATYAEKQKSIMNFVNLCKHVYKWYTIE